MFCLKSASVRLIHLDLQTHRVYANCAVELENYLLARGEPLPPSEIANQLGSSASSILTPVISPLRRTSDPLSAWPQRQASRGSQAALNPTPPTTSGSVSLITSSPHATYSLTNPDQTPINNLALSLHSRQDFGPPSQAIVSGTFAEIPPHSLLEVSLIRLILPYTPFISIPLHPQRFLALLTLSTSDPSRPHPALLYILFAEAVRILECNTPPPKTHVYSGLHHFSAPTTTDDENRAWLLPKVRGHGLLYLERARTELDRGIRNVDRPFDLVRAATGITRYLYSLGRFIEGWNIPVARLAVSCGLHRLTGNITPPFPPMMTGEYPPTEYMPQPYATTQFYLYQHACTALPQPAPNLRMRPLILPPPRDEIDLAERVMTFWAAKAQDWAGGIGWGWATGLSDDECTTEWPWGIGGAEVSH
jgi:hypothetical protein